MDEETYTTADRPVMPDFVGTSIEGRFTYDLRELIDEGGFAIVYRGWDEAMSREVAVKILKPSSSPEIYERLRKRFVMEAQIYARLDNRAHIVNVLEDGTFTHDGEEYNFLVMEFLRGETLTQYLSERDAIAPHIVQEFLEQMGTALQETHRHGLLHRDLKPDNIMVLNRSGFHAVLFDFGIAKAIEDQDAQAPSHEAHERPWQRHLTQEGKVLCTPPYAAREQVFSKGVNAYTDLYALGVIAYEALMNDHPFLKEDGSSKDAQTIALDLLTGPDWRLSEELAATALGQIVHKLLCKDPTQRYQTASELLCDLALLRAGHVETSPSGGEVLISPPTERLSREFIPISAPPTAPLEASGEDTMLLSEASPFLEARHATLDLDPKEMVKMARSEFVGTREMLPGLHDPMSEYVTTKYKASDLPDRPDPLHQDLDPEEEERPLTTSDHVKEDVPRVREAPVTVSAEIPGPTLSSRQEFREEQDPPTHPLTTIALIVAALAIITCGVVLVMSFQEEEETPVAPVAIQEDVVVPPDVSGAIETAHVHVSSSVKRAQHDLPTQPQKKDTVVLSKNPKKDPVRAPKKEASKPLESVTATRPPKTTHTTPKPVAVVEKPKEISKDTVPKEEKKEEPKPKKRALTPEEMRKEMETWSKVR